MELLFGFVDIVLASSGIVLDLGLWLIAPTVLVKE